MRDERKAGKRSAYALAVLLLFLAVINGCSSGNKLDELPPQQLTEEETPVEPIPPAEEEEAETAGYLAPLTGLAVDHEVTARPIAVMVNNMGKARPQSGLPHADVVWEVLAEGGITRLVAIFQSEEFTDAIGPIRSIRPYLIELGESYGGVLVHAGGSPDAYSILQHQGKEHLDEITNAGSYFWRESFRKAPHNLYSNLEKLRAGIDKKKYDQSVMAPLLTFSELGATGAGTAANHVDISFMLKNYKVSYAYDPQTKLYMRSINDQPHTDLTTKAQLSATNLVVLGTAHKVLDDVGRLEVDLDSGGPAKLIQLGRVIDCQWERGVDGVIRILQDGNELPLAPGKTYYHVVPNTPTFEGHVTIS
ncbi:hypothetical protein FHS18_004013 [Paenibacillus phyllosphaerae]|uniref:DUF3048 domain-containing protein n=1 Tax=Paenibacillus phyllosphaerae TaxID=274593 RepID=A0A7W5B012_9BACL|nr:DUF3048 domain-containing protein [Paenibacillus phyllosphaerae]MBB3111945.1 hypothetical protein [Paenibacillus phyllosphaerae]